MSDELYESLIEIYKSFILEKENILKKLELNNNDNEYQLYNKYLYIIDSRINTLSALLKLFESYLVSKKKGGFEKELIIKHLQILDIQ